MGTIEPLGPMEPAPDAETLFCLDGVVGACCTVVTGLDLDVGVTSSDAPGVALLAILPRVDRFVGAVVEGIAPRVLVQ